MSHLKKLSQIPIGGSEDETKQTVKNHFRKKSGIDYKKVDSDFLNHANLEHDLKIEELSFLLYKESLALFGDGEELTDKEEFTISLLSRELKGIKIPNYEDLWKTPPAGLNGKELQKFNNALATYKAYKFLIFPDELAGDEFFADIMKELAGAVINDLIAPDGYYIENDTYWEICKRIAEKVQNVDSLYDITDALGLEGCIQEIDIERYL